MAAYSDPYSWIQRESFISPSQEELLHKIAGWDDAKPCQSLSPATTAMAGSSANPISCDSSESDSSANASQQAFCTSFLLPRTVEIGSPDDLEQERHEESFNPAFESDRSQSPCFSESPSLPNVVLVDDPCNAFVTQGFPLEHAPDKCPKESSALALSNSASTLKIDPKISISKDRTRESESPFKIDPNFSTSKDRRLESESALKIDPKFSTSKDRTRESESRKRYRSLSPLKVDTKFLLLKDHVQESECRMKHHLPMQVEKLLKQKRGSSPSERLKQPQERAVEEVQEVLIPGFKCKVEEKLTVSGLVLATKTSKDGNSAGKPFLSPILRKDAETTRNISICHKTPNRKFHDLTSGRANDKHVAMSVDTNAAGPLYDNEVQKEHVTSISRKKSRTVLNETGYGSKSSALQLFNDPESSEQIHVNVPFDPEGPVNISVTDQVTSGSIQKDLQLDKVINVSIPVSHEPLDKGSGRNLRKKDSNYFPESLLDVILHNSGSLPPLSNADFRTIAKKAGLNLPPPFGRK